MNFWLTLGKKCARTITFKIPTTIKLLQKPNIVFFYSLFESREYERKKDEKKEKGERIYFCLISMRQENGWKREWENEKNL